MGEPKERLPLPNGRTFLENALDLLSRLTDMQVVAGGEPSTTEGVRMRKSPLTHPFKPPFLHIMDLRPGEGPLAGIEAALATGFGGGYLVIACDQPKLSAALLNRLLNEDADRIHAFEAEGSVIPLPVYVPQSALPAVRKAMNDGVRSLRQFIKPNNPYLVELPLNELSLLQSVNTPEEYQNLWGELTVSPLN